jgi:hypothetical protein
MLGKGEDQAGGAFHGGQFKKKRQPAGWRNPSCKRKSAIRICS